MSFCLGLVCADICLCILVGLEEEYVQWTEPSTKTTAKSRKHKRFKTYYAFINACFLKDTLSL